MEKHNLFWVDEFIEKVKPYIYVRLDDNLLIKRPNNAQKLNKTGAIILKKLLDGASINEIIKKIGDNPSKLYQLESFLWAVRHSLEGKLDVFTLNKAVEKKPFNMKFSQYPVLSELAITYRCNLKCRFCYAGCNDTSNPINSHNELSTKQLKQLIDKIFFDAKVPSISFTGGEPLLRKDLPELIAHAKKHKMRVNLITNGTLIDEKKAKKLVRAGLDSAQVSLEGIKAFTHDDLVRVNGAFQKTLIAIDAFKKVGLHVHTNTTLTRKNIEEAICFPRFVKNTLGLDKFSMNMIIPTGSGAMHNEVILYYHEMGDCIRKIITESKKHDVEFMWYSPLPMCMFNTIPHGLGNKGCSACDGLLSLAPNGDVLPCASYNMSVGNLLKEDFLSIWQNDKSKYCREKQFAHEYCKECEHFHICNGACPLYWRQIGYKELNEIIDNQTVKI